MKPKKIIKKGVGIDKKNTQTKTGGIILTTNFLLLSLLLVSAKPPVNTAHESYNDNRVYSECLLRYILYLRQK